MSSFFGKKKKQLFKKTKINKLNSFCAFEQLDKDFHAKVSGYGVQKLRTELCLKNGGFYSGNLRWCAPELFEQGPNEKSDVFGFTSFSSSSFFLFLPLSSSFFLFFSFWNSWLFGHHYYFALLIGRRYGVILYELATRKIPFGDIASDFALLPKIQVSFFLSFSSLNGK